MTLQSILRCVLTSYYELRYEPASKLTEDDIDLYCRMRDEHE